MSKTIEQIQEMITNKADAREVINEIADYLQANPGGSSGGTGTLPILQSPDNTLWLIGVNNAGALQTTQVGEGTPTTLTLFSPDNTEWEVSVTDEGALITTEI